MNSNFKKKEKEKEKVIKEQKIEGSSSDNWKMDVQDFTKNGCLLNAGD